MRHQGPLLFLDFDGVAHPTGRGDFSNAPYIRSIITRLSEACGRPASVVITSTWRLGGFDPVRAALWLGLDLSQIEGCTPNIEHRRRGAEILSWIESHDAHARPWIVAEDNPTILGGIDLPRRALLPFSETGLFGPAWADAAVCLVRAQAPGFEASRLDDLHRSWASLTQTPPSARCPGLFAPARALAGQGATLGWLTAVEAATGSAHAGDALGGAEICLASGSSEARHQALKAILNMIEPGDEPASADLWDAALALSRGNPELGTLMACCCMRLGAARGATEPEASAIRVAVGTARSDPEALALAKSMADSERPLCLPALDGVRAWGRVPEAQLARLEHFALSAARESLGTGAVDTWHQLADARLSQSRRRPSTGSARL